MIFDLSIASVPAASWFFGNWGAVLTRCRAPVGLAARQNAKDREN